MEMLGYDKNVGAVAVNMTFVASDKYDSTILQEGDEVEILAPVCGG
jgi:sulfur carrier protein